MRLKSNVLAGTPAGSYLATCRDIKYFDGLLSARCRTRSSGPVMQWQPSILRVPETYSDIVNCDGSLTLDDCNNMREW